MFHRHTTRPVFGSSLVLGLALADGLVSFAGHAWAADRHRTLITDRIDEHALVTLHGNTRPEANAVNDRGIVPDTMPLNNMTLQLQRPPEQDDALDRMIDALHDPSSASYHRWLTPKQVADGYGLAPSDIAAVIGWLRKHGFHINVLYGDGIAIDISGTAGQVREAFHIELHSLSVGGVAHVANMSDPQIPAALAPVVAGIVRLNDFAPQPQYEANPQYAFSCKGSLTKAATTCQAVTPADLATIYNINPAFKAGIIGVGQRIAVIESSDVDKIADWSTFRTKYGLANYKQGSVAQTHPEPSGGKANCSDPGIGTAADEAILDAEWSSAAAPGAHIVLAACKTTVSQDGLLTAVRNLTEDSAKTRPQIFSISYGECEADIGATANAAIASAYKTAVAGGVSVFVSGGDQLSAACDRNAHEAVHGNAVNARASTPYNVAVGGTDFGDVFLRQSATYWTTGNSAVDGSAKSYIPEIPWNGSCASELTASYLGFATTYGKKGLCNSTTYATLLKVGGGGGGPSACATGAPTKTGIVGGTCAGYARPSWQAGVPGLPADHIRDLPDVVLFASASPWDHSYVICSSGDGGCTVGHGGTSFAAPIMAGVQALVNQKMSATTGEGNPNVVYYKLAATEYGSATELAACNTIKGKSVGTSCIFHDVTTGDNDAPCHSGSPDCYLPSGSYGVLSSSSGTYQPTFRSTPGWDFASGLGSVNVFNLVSQWHTVAPKPN
jgi:subtilase family serine protease